MKIIFLDIDGVLNGYGLFFHILCSLHIKSNCLNDILQNEFDGIVKRRVKRLAKIVKKTGAKVVLTSSKRLGWKKDKSTIKNLDNYFRKYHINIIDITPKISGCNSRSIEILTWLNQNKVDNFVILDDEIFDFDKYFQKKVVITSKNGIICGHWRENSGLKGKHIHKAINILKGEYL